MPYTTENPGRVLACLPGPSLGITPGGEIEISGQGIPVNVDNFLRITVYNSAAVTLRLSGLLLTKDGHKPISENFIPTTDRSASVVLSTLTEGLLRSFAVRLTSGTSQRGQTWVVVELQLTNGLAPLVTQVISQGYVTNSAGISFPTSRIVQSTEGPGFSRSLTLANPGAGNHVDYTLTPNLLWKIKAVSYVLLTNATVINRRPRIIYNPQGGTASRMDPAENVQTASLVRAWLFSPRDFTHAEDATTGDHYESFPELVARSGDHVGEDTVNLQAGDQVQGFAFDVEEWINV